MPATLRRTLEICIDPAAADGTWPVRARVLETNESARSVMQLALADADFARAATWLAAGFPAVGGPPGASADGTGAGATAALGAQLFDALFTGPVAVLYAQVSSQLGYDLAFWLIVDDSRLAAAPWELLYDSSRRRFLAFSAPFARGLSSSRAPVAPPPGGPLRVLMAAAFPRGLPGPEPAAELAAVEQSLGRQVGAGVQLVHLPHATAARVQNALREAQASGAPFDVLHILCHGANDGATGARVLLLEDDAGDPVPLAAPALAALLGGEGVQVVFLNACSAAAVTAGELAPAFAQALLDSGVTVLVGMQAPVRVEDAVRFATAFYAALADGRSADAALLDVRRLAQVDGGGDSATAVIPVCYTRALPAQLRGAPLAAPLLPAQPWWRRAWRRTAAAAALIVGLIAGYLTLRDFVCGPPAVAGPLLDGVCAMLAPAPLPTVAAVPPAPTPTPWLTGDIKLAVAEFSALDAGGAAASPQGAELAQQLYAVLQPALATAVAQAPLTVVVGASVPPFAAGPITGVNAAEQAQNAAARAADINADVLVYGNLKQEPGRATLNTYFYLAPQQLTYAEELADVYPLFTITSTGELQSNAITRADLRAQLLAQADGVTGLMLGMGHFNRGEYGAAKRWLLAADAALAASGSARRAVVQLFLGSVAAQEGDRTLAHQFYDSAYRLDGRLARALLGRGQTVFLLARRGCTAGATDVQGVEAAIADYMDARDQASSPLAAITIKANLSLGSAYLCLALAGAGDDYWSEAGDQLNNVLGDYAAAEDPRLRYLAAEAHERLGALAVAEASRGGVAGGYAPDQIEAAADHFVQAAALSLEPGNQARVHLWLAWIAAVQGRCAGARQELESARTAFGARRGRDSLSLGYQSFLADFNDLNNQLVQPQLAQQCAS